MRLAGCEPKIHVRVTWEINLEDTQVGNGSLRPETQRPPPTTPAQLPGLARLLGALNHPPLVRPPNGC